MHLCLGVPEAEAAIEPYRRKGSMRKILSAVLLLGQQTLDASDPIVVPSKLGSRQQAGHSTTSHAGLPAPALVTAYLSTKAKAAGGRSATELSLRSETQEK